MLDGPIFDWTPPSLSVRGEWYNKQVATLWEAAVTLPNPEEVVKEGLGLLTMDTPR
jgi:hypothetical protein